MSTLSPEQHIAINDFASNETVSQDRLDRVVDAATTNPVIEVARQAVQTVLDPETTAELHRRAAVEQILANNPEIDETRATAILKAQGLLAQDQKTN